MASGSVPHLPAFDDIIKRGSATEPRSSRPTPRLRDANAVGELSLNAAVGKTMKANTGSIKTKKIKRNTNNEESGFSSESSRDMSRKRTPMTLSRTKVTTATPLEQRLGLNILKQKLNFEDKKQNANKELQDSVKKLECAANCNNNIPFDLMSASSVTQSELSDINVDKMNERLDQVREYLKQATSMYVSLSIAGSEDPKRAEQMSKLARLIQQLRIQEQGYLDLFQRTMTYDGEGDDVTSLLSEDQTATGNENEADQLNNQHQEIQRLREQQALLKKIVDQQKELQELKDKQSALLQMQHNAESLIEDQNVLNNVPNNQRTKKNNENKFTNNAKQLNKNEQRIQNRDNDVELLMQTGDDRHQLENKLLYLQAKKDKMDQAMSTLKALKDSQANMASNVLNQDDLNDLVSELASIASSNEEPNVPKKIENMNLDEKITQLNDVRQRLNELRGIVADYEANIPQEPTATDSIRDNRLHAQAILQKLGDTITGVGGAKLRIPKNANQQNMLRNDLDNRNRPTPQKNEIDVTRNPPSPKHKNTNQEKKMTSDIRDLEALINDLPPEYQQKVKDIQIMKQQLENKSNNYHLHEDDTSETETVESPSEKESAVESDGSSALQWQDDPEFNNKVKKLQMAKEKLHHLQQLVKVVQQGGGPHLPVNDLETLTISDNENSDESDEDDEEDMEEENEEETCDEQTEDEEEADTEQTEEDEKSEISKSTDLYYNLIPENGSSDNERRYQGLLRKQRLELNYLLKERERLLEAQQKLSVMSSQPASVVKKSPNSSHNKTNNKKSQKTATYPALTKEQLSNQKFKKRSEKQNFLSKLNGMDADAPYAEYYQPTVDIGNQSEDKVPVTGLLKNPLAASEIRRQRDLFEQKKKQKVLEKQQRKKIHGRAEGENQSDDRATYSVHSDIDEGVGISMYSADVTTAATWGGSTEQSSSDDGDSAVGESYAATGEIANEDDGDVYGSQFDQVEEEEEETLGNNLPPIFKVKKYEDTRPRRGISWHQNDVTPGKKRKLTEKKSDASQGNGSVTWSLDVSPPRSRRKPRQGNLTPAHKLIQDQHKKRVSKFKQDQQAQLSQSVNIFDPNNDPSGQLHCQLASMCTSLVRNEQTLLSMLQSQTAGAVGAPVRGGNSVQPAAMNNVAYNNIQEYFETSNYPDGFQQTMSCLKQCYERLEHHQQDMEFLHQQFSMLNTSPPDTNHATPCEFEYKSPWPNPPSLHMSSLHDGGGTKQCNSKIPASVANMFKPKKLSYQKETQTDTTLFDDPFKPSIQPYTLFGQTSADPAIFSPNKKESNDFIFDPVLEPVSPGAIGDRSFNHKYDIQGTTVVVVDNKEDARMFPYLLRMSEYNPLSYQGNFANTSTGNVITMSRMSMSKDHAETNVTNRAERIWPSFFKLNGSVVDINDHMSEKCFNKIVQPNVEPPSMASDMNKATDIRAVGNASTVDMATGSSGESNFSLFEALRDSIYSEVATLIAMNESRPHYLIELFRELQLLNSDYLRQRALYSLQELVTRFLTDETSSPGKKAFKQETIKKADNEVASSPQYEQWAETASEQTASESVMTTDDEGEAQALQSLARQIQNNEMYDYAELVDSQSDCNLSTPGSQSENPFDVEDLGNTVINLDEALQKMRSYEQGMAEAKKAFEKISNDVHESTPTTLSDFNENRKKAAFDAIKRRMSNQTDSVSNCSAGDVGSETSSDMPQPSVDTQKLDQQIKSVMVDLIPFLNENINAICTDSLLDQIRNLILHFAKQKEPESDKEQFGRFFHSQLDSILRDSLMKFNGRSLKECGEDLLIDVSEILFNELAFFKLMQDLDRPLYSEAVGVIPIQDKESNRRSKMPFVESAKIEKDLHSACQSVDSIDATDATAAVKKSNSNSSSSSSNAFVMIDAVAMETDEETESSRQFVKVELSQSESQPVRSSGSGEDDNEEELSVFAQQEAPTSSMHAYSHHEATTASEANQASEDDTVNEAAIEVGSIEDELDEGDQVLCEDERNERERGEADEAEVEVDAENENAEDQRDLYGEVEDENVEGESRRIDVDEDDRSEEDDLPEADMVSDTDMTAAAVVLLHLEGQQELVGENTVTPPQL